MVKAAFAEQSVRDDTMRIEFIQDWISIFG
jgi:hypothetical protein